MMRELRCRYCGYFHCATDAVSGRIRFVCRRCHRQQTVALEDDVQVPPAGRRGPQIPP